MRTLAENDRLTRVGAGTPCGELMRKYWHPIGTSQSLDARPVQPVRILGETLVLYRTRSGQLGLIQQHCPHRGASLEFGIPEDEGLRCCYHGWLFDSVGRCLETPLEPPASSLKDRVAIRAYPVEELGGLIWGYLGTDQPPLLPRWDLFIRPGGFRQIVGHVLPCNWLQVQENRGDLGHAPFLHGHLFRYVLQRQGRLTEDSAAFYNVQYYQEREQRRAGTCTRYRPIYNEFGMTKGMLPTDGDESSPSWQVGLNPILFPYLLAFGPGTGIRSSYQLGVPIDDTHTWHLEYICYNFPEDCSVPEQSTVPYVEIPLDGPEGKPVLDYVLAQDMVAWYGQGEVVDRTAEHLGASDRIVVAYRKLLDEQITTVERGGEPLNRFWDREQATSPELRIAGFGPDVASAYGSGREFRSLRRQQLHHVSAGGWPYLDDEVDRYLPDRDLILRLYAEAETTAAAKADRSLPSGVG